MDARDFIEIATKQEKLEQWVSQFTAAHKDSQVKSAQDTLLKNLNKSATPRTVKHFRSAFEQGNSYIEDREAIFEAVELWPQSLEFASTLLRSDRKLVMLAVTQWGYALQFASDELKNDQELVREALSNAPLAFAHVSPSLRADRGIAIPAIRQKSRNLKYCSLDIRGDKNIVKEAINNETWDDAPSLYYALAHLWADTELLALTEKKEQEKEKHRQNNNFYS